RSRPYNLPNSWSIEAVTPFDDYWQRTITLDTSLGVWKKTQRLVILTPEYAKVQIKDYNWDYYYFTRELGPEVVRGLLFKHMRLTNQPRTKFEQRLKVYRFLLQAGWTEHARKEMKEIYETFPAERKRLEPLQKALQQLINAETAQAIEQCYKAG